MIAPGRFVRPGLKGSPSTPGLVRRVLTSRGGSESLGDRGLLFGAFIWSAYFFLERTSGGSSAGDPP